MEITYPRTNEANCYGGLSETCSTSAVRCVPAKMLICDKSGEFIPCNYRDWTLASDRGVYSGNHYIPSGDAAIDPKNLEVIHKISFESDRSEGEDFRYFIRNLMKEPPVGVKFVKYEGVEEVILPQEYHRWFGLNVAKKQLRKRFKHHFALCKLASPFDVEYEEVIQTKKRQQDEAIKRRAELLRSICSTSVAEYFKMTGKEFGAFDQVPLYHVEEGALDSDRISESLDKLLASARNNFVKKAPQSTECIVDAHEDISQISQSFLFLPIRYHHVVLRGVALVPR